MPIDTFYRGPSAFSQVPGFTFLGGFFVPLSVVPPTFDLLGVGSVSTSLVDYPKTGSVTTGDIWVDPTGSNGTGTEGSPFNNFASAFAAVSDGERIIVRAGTITLSSGISRNTSWATGIEVFAYGNERPVIIGQASGDILTISGQREHWKGFEFKNAQRFTVFITGSNNTIEDCWGHNGDSSGFYIFGTTPTGNVIQDCRGWNFGPTGQSGVDIFKCAGPDNTARNQGGNKFVRCFAKWGGDDNFDLFNSYGNEIIDCVSTRAGYVWTGSSEVRGWNGSGYKLGDRGNPGGNSIKGSVAYRNFLHGITHNFTDGDTPIINCTSVDNEYIGYQKDVVTSPFRNNIADGNRDGAVSTGSIRGTYNSWNVAADAGGNAAFPLSTAELAFANRAAFDFSLLAGSEAIGSGVGGVNLGASNVALGIAKEWLPKDLT